jgi:predicted nucleic acid-binding protein
MLVVSDTSPIRGLSAIDQLGLIQKLFGEAFLPPAVMAELAVPVAHLPPVTTERFPFLRPRAPADQRRVAELRTRLNAGEAEAIALALELKADALLIDEQRGRRIAGDLGLRPIGVLGVLTAAKFKGMVPALSPLIDQLRARIGFRIDGALLARVLREAGE